MAPKDEPQRNARDLTPARILIGGFSDPGVSLTPERRTLAEWVYLLEIPVILNPDFATLLNGLS